MRAVIINNKKNFFMYTFLSYARAIIKNYTEAAIHGKFLVLVFVFKLIYLKQVGYKKLDYIF